MYTADVRERKRERDRQREREREREIDSESERERERVLGFLNVLFMLFRVLGFFIAP